MAEEMIINKSTSGTAVTTMYNDEVVSMLAHYINALQNLVFINNILKPKRMIKYSINVVIMFSVLFPALRRLY